MNDKIIKINTKTSEANKQDYYLGTRGQNLQNKLIFEMSEKIQGVAWLEYEINGAKNYALMEETETGYQIDIKSCLLVGQTIKVDLRITEDENPLGVPVFVSTISTFNINNSIEATEEEPEYYPSWFDIANQKILEMDNLDVNVVKEGTVATITKTNKDGTTTSVDINDGDSGITVFSIENGHLIGTSENATNLTNYSMSNGHLYLTIEE